LSSAPELRRGLGRGLDVLIGGGERQATLVELPVAAIHANPRQPRRNFDGEASSGLAESIRAQGVLQPVVVRPRQTGGWELIAGERRWRAARDAGVDTLPALVREADDRDSLLLALVENVAREQLSAVEEARAYAVLLDEFGLALGEVAGRVGRSRPAVSNRLRLLELPDDVLELVENGSLTEGHARAVLAVPDHEGRRALARAIVARGLSVRAAEAAARATGARRRPRKRAAVDPALADRARSAARRSLGVEVVVRPDRIELPYAGEAGLEELVEALERLGP
jgi:ParB family chromosome partitioning protein